MGRRLDCRRGLRRHRSARSGGPRPSNVQQFLQVMRRLLDRFGFSRLRVHPRLTRWSRIPTPQHVLQNTATGGTRTARGFAAKK